MPADLLHAIEHANRVLDWQENLSTEEMPPEWMWTLDEEVVTWMEQVNEDRKERYGGGSSRDDDTDGGPMMSNDLSRGRR